MKIFIAIIITIVLAILVTIIVKHTTSSDLGLVTSTSGVRPEKNITIKGSSTGNTITLSVDSLGKISFKQTITKTITETINPQDVDKSSSKQLTSPISIRFTVTKDYVYTTNGIFYTRTTIKQGNNKAKISVKAYDLSKGPLPPFQTYTISDKLKSIGYSNVNDFFTPKVRQYYDIMFKNIIVPKVAEYNKKYKTNIVITTLDDYINTTWFNVAGFRDRLYQPNKTINSKFLGLSTVSIYSGITKITPPTWASGVKIENTLTKSILKKNKEGVEELVTKTIELPKYEAINPLKNIFTPSAGYNEKLVSQNPSAVLLNPLLGINFDNFETIPRKETGYQDLSNNIDYFDQAFANTENRNAFIQGMFKDPKTYKIVNNKDFSSAEQDYYYPVDTSKSIEEITKLNPNVKRPAIIYGLVKMPSQSVIEQGEKLSETLRKRYDNCRYQLEKVKWPYTDGKSCADSQDAALSHYVYKPAKDCDKVKIGDAWCSYESTEFLDSSGGDNMLICEWGDLKHDSPNIQGYQKILFTFEGTEVNVFDWMADLCVIPWPVPALGCMVHIGFWSKFCLWIPKILKYLRASVVERDIDGNPSKIRTPFKKVIFVGHSLGGAIAHLASAYIQSLCVDRIEVEVASQGAPSPFWIYKPIDSFFINYPKRFKGYFHDECFANPNRDDPVPDILYWLGFLHWFDFEAPVRRNVRRGWSWDLFEGGWFRCAYKGGYFDTEENYISLLRIFLNVVGGGVLGEVVDALLGFALEHTITEYFPKISNTQCPAGSYDPTPDRDFDQMDKAGFCNNSGDCLNGGSCTVIDPEGYKCDNYSG
jgi:hypothetical protein